jgi:hypothetical protein
MLRNREDAALAGSGFEQIIANLWVKGGVRYKRTNNKVCRLYARYLRVNSSSFLIANLSTGACA